MSTADTRSNRIAGLIRRHQRLKSALRRALKNHPDSQSLLWPFNNVFRPWQGTVATADQSAAIEWRQMLGALIADVRLLYAPWDDDDLRDLFPLVDWQSRDLSNRSSHWVLQAIDSQIKRLRDEASQFAGDEREEREAGGQVHDSAVEQAHGQLPRSTLAETELITAAEAAKMMQLTKGRIYELCRQCKLPGVVRIGRQVRIDRKKLAAFIESGGGLSGD